MTSATIERAGQGGSYTFLTDQEARSKGSVLPEVSPRSNYAYQRKNAAADSAVTPSRLSSPQALRRRLGVQVAD